MVRLDSVNMEGNAMKLEFALIQPHLFNKQSQKGQIVFKTT